MFINISNIVLLILISYYYVNIFIIYSLYKKEIYVNISMIK